MKFVIPTFSNYYEIIGEFSYEKLKKTNEN